MYNFFLIKKNFFTCKSDIVRKPKGDKEISCMYPLILPYIGRQRLSVNNFAILASPKKSVDNLSRFRYSDEIIASV
jgi:hypothetical protein